VRSTCSRRFWLIARHRTGGMEVLRITLACGEEVLPVFSFEDEAKMFLELGALDGWRVRVTTAGELVSVLFGPCAGVRRVALDPLPGQDAAALVGPVNMERRVFMESLLEIRGDLTVGHGHEHSGRQGDVIARRATLKRG
jgi:hypothetical protein